MSIVSSTNKNYWKERKPKFIQSSRANMIQIIYYCHDGRYHNMLDLKNHLKKLTQLDSDIFFLTTCRKEHLIPQRLTIWNPTLHIYNSICTQNLRTRSSERLKNKMIQPKKNHKNDVQNTARLQENDTTEMENKLLSFYKGLQRILISNKKKKLQRLRLHFSTQTHKNSQTVLSTSSHTNLQKQK